MRAQIYYLIGACLLLMSVAIAVANSPGAEHQAPDRSGVVAALVVALGGWFFMLGGGCGRRWRGADVVWVLLGRAVAYLFGSGLLVIATLVAAFALHGLGELLSGEAGQFSGAAILVFAPVLGLLAAFIGCLGIWVLILAGRVGTKPAEG